MELLFIRENDKFRVKLAENLRKQLAYGEIEDLKMNPVKIYIQRNEHRWTASLSMNEDDQVVLLFIDLTEGEEIPFENLHILPKIELLYR